MKNIILSIAFLIYGLKGIAQNQSKEIGLDSLCSSLENTIVKYKLDYSYIGEVYMIISDVRNEKIENPKIGTNNNVMYYDILF